MSGWENLTAEDRRLILESLRRSGTPSSAVSRRPYNELADKLERDPTIQSLTELVESIKATTDAEMRRVTAQALADVREMANGIAKALGSCVAVLATLSEGPLSEHRAREAVDQAVEGARAMLLAWAEVGPPVDRMVEALNADPPT